ncbi:VapE domain-containing protein [Nostoc sp. ChiSLP03a]|uniref:VapE domain-containing protein n=1 Tax=Nostoc sp. ChiSLP03a TaxID=3075380 RepID=UPI002AD28BB0|nr:VapE domain-containing protein [Nostoc sp. ChiSLP03a]MDZ8211338.1 VapE family protein [Nostoc sp. ChiSLP03a]
MDYSNKTNSNEVDMSDYSSFNDTQSSFDSDDKSQDNRKAALDLVRIYDIFAVQAGSGGDKSRSDDPKGNGDVYKAKKAAKFYIQSADEKAFAFWQVFEAVYGGIKKGELELTQDAWAGTVYYKGKSTTIGKLVAKLERVLEIPRPRTSEGFYDRQLDIFLENRKVKPVKKYLDGCLRQYSKEVEVFEVASEDYDNGWELVKAGTTTSYIDTKVDLLPEWDSLGKVLFGTDDPLTQEMITTWLVGAVKRGIDPGCYNKRTIILKGSQDAGKSAFVSKLAKHWGTELPSGTSEMDFVRQCSRTWIMELAECDRLFKGRDASILKQQLSTTVDKYVPKYKEADEMAITPRTTVFIGTTNKSQFLVDDTGNKRFWVIDLADNWKLPLAWLDENVDQLWATAYHKLLNGHPTDLSEDSQVASEVRNREYMVEGSWVEQLERVLDIATKEGNREIAFKVVDIQLAMGTHADNQGKNKTAVINSLKQLGYEQRSKKVGSKTERVYALKTAESPIMAKYVGAGEWCYWSTKLGGWQSNQDVTIEVRKEARGQA